MYILYIYIYIYVFLYILYIYGHPPKIYLFQTFVIAFDIDIDSYQSRDQQHFPSPHYTSWTKDQLRGQLF